MTLLNFPPNDLYTVHHAYFLASPVYRMQLMLNFVPNIQLSNKWTWI